MVTLPFFTKTGPIITRHRSTVNRYFITGLQLCNFPCMSCRKCSITWSCTRGKGGILFPKRIPPFDPPEKGEGSPPSTPALAVGRLKRCAACGIGCLPSNVSKRFGLLLFSLPLCLRFGSLTQFPPTSDVIGLAGAYRGGIAALAARGCALFSPLL